MKSIFLRTSLFAVMVAVSGFLFSVHAQTVSGSIAGSAVTRGKSSRATVVLNIPRGLHVNSYRPNSEYAIPTTVRVSAPGASIGPVSYPRGRNRKFEFSQDSINVYEGRAVFGFNVTVPPTFRGSTVRVNVTVNYQACTHEVCYPPKSKIVTLTARVR